MKVNYRALYILALLNFFLLFVSEFAYSIDTAGCMLHVDQQFFNHQKLIQLSWEAEVKQYSHLPSGSNPFKYRIEFNSVGFSGVNGTHYVGAMIMNLNHSFNNDAFGSRPTEIPGLGLYLSSLNSTWADSRHGVKLLTDPNSYPNFGRVFENVDALGFSAKNIYSRVTIGDPGSSPIKLKWIITKSGVVSNPTENLSKSLSGSWVSLSGTFVIWNFKIEINGVLYNVADYYLPIEYAEFLISGDPLVLHQEYFGSSTSILNSQKTKVRYSNIKASDGSLWYNLDKWKLTWRIDDETGNLDSRFGWRLEDSGKYIVSTCGQDDDPSIATRLVGSSLNLSSLPGNNQTITFNAPPIKTVGDVAFSLSATASSGLPIQFSSTSDKVSISGSLVTILKAGSVTITATQAGDANFSAATSVNQSFCIKPSKPTITVSGANTEAITLTSSSTTGNLWYKDGTAITGATNVTLSVNTVGVYKVQVKADDCLSEFSTDTPFIITGDLSTQSNGITIYPNPVEDYLEVRGLKGEISTSQLSDITGRTSTLTLEQRNAQHRANVQHLSQGVYLLRVQQGKSIYQIKFIKQ